MTTSGSWDYLVTASTIITGALENINALEAGETVDSDDSAMALRTLNLLTKQWQGTSDMAQGLKVWTRQRVTLFLALNQLSYLIGPGSSDARATTAYGRTTVSSAYASGTSLSVTALTDSTTNVGSTVTMTASDIIGVVLDSGDISWTTISAAVSSPITLGGALAGAAAAGNYVYWFTSRAQRFPVCEYAVLRDENLIDTGLTIYTDVRQYESLPQKNGQGDPTAILIEPLTTQTRVTLDFAPQNMARQVRLTVIYPAEDYDLTTNDIAYPQEWYAALEWELARRLAPKFNKTWTPTHQQSWQDATAIARELNPANTSIYYQPYADGRP